MNESAAPYAPAQWDALLNTTNTPQELRALLEGAPAHVRVRREMQLATNKFRPEAIAEALSQLEQHGQEATLGIRLMAHIPLQGYAYICDVSEVPLQSLEPYAVEDACDAAFARAMAFAETGQFHVAEAQLLLAHKLATALGMHYRAQHIDMEWGRILTNAGTPQPQRIIDAMARLPLTIRRRTWGLRCLAEAYIALGDYPSAQTQQHRPVEPLQDYDAKQQFGLADFIGALTGVRQTEHLSSPEDPYTPIAAALWGLRDRQPVSIPKLTGSSPQADYRILIRAWAQLRTRSMALQAYNMLHQLVVRTPDQRAHRAAALIYANAQAQQQDDIELLIAELNTALEAMTTRDHFLNLLRAINPEAYVLLGSLPDIHPDITESLPEIAILTGGSISYRYQVFGLPGQTNGSSILVQAALRGSGGPESRPHPQAAQRIRQTLAHLCVTEYINIGIVLRHLQHFRQCASLERVEVWETALHQTLTWVDSAVVLEDLKHQLAL